jgi:hypothetical protein
MNRREFFQGAGSVAIVAVLPAMPISDLSPLQVLQANSIPWGPTNAEMFAIMEHCREQIEEITGLHRELLG